MAGWNADTAAGPLGAGSVTLVEGTSFCISLSNGDIGPDQPHGLFIQDTRILSTWKLTINGQTVEPLTAQSTEPYRVSFAGRISNPQGYADSPLIVKRQRELGAGMTERIILHNHSTSPVDCAILLAVGSDFADVFEVKEARIHREWQQSRRVGASSLIIKGAWRDVHKSAIISADGAHVGPEGLSYSVAVPPHGRWDRTITVTAQTDNSATVALKTKPIPELSPSDRRRSEWVAKIPVFRLGNHSIERTLRRSYDDLGALRIEDPAHPERVVVAAGAPWFMTLFGRDSLWASEMAIPIDPSLALGTLQTLADRQGKVVDPLTEEEPGKILHEVRLDISSNLALGGKSTYYGSVDATPLFVAVLGSVSRWGFSKDTITALLPHADRALDWIQEYGDKDGDGFVEYERLNPSGLINQGWKDSWDGINFTDGTLAAPPIALCEVQAYVYDAYMARAWMAYDSGDLTLAAKLTKLAADLKARFNEQFWMPDKGYYAVALDANKQQVDACTSNMGHCLWVGLIDEDKAPYVAERLMSPEMFSGWGVRTLATTMGAYNPASYHNGSVWPHDNAVIAAGLMRYGFVEEAQRIATAQFEAADYSQGRLPELFCGFSREEYSEPVPYPTACSPQAWAATSPIQLITSLMRYDAHISRNGFWMDPHLPESYGDLHISNAPMGGGRLIIDIKASNPAVRSLPEGLTFHRGHRPWLTELMSQAHLRTDAPSKTSPPEGGAQEL